MPTSPTPPPPPNNPGNATPSGNTTVTGRRAARRDGSTRDRQGRRQGGGLRRSNTSEDLPTPRNLQMRGSGDGTVSGIRDRIPTRTGSTAAASHSPVPRNRRTPGRSISMNASGLARNSSTRRVNVNANLSDDETADLLGTSARVSGSRYARSAVASRMNTTTTTMGSFGEGDSPRTSNADEAEASAATAGTATDALGRDGSNHSLGHDDILQGGASAHDDTSATAMKRMHNSTVALRFLENPDDSDEFELESGFGAPPTQPSSAASRNNNAMMNASANFNMSQLKFPTVSTTNNNTGAGIFDEDEEKGAPIGLSAKASSRYAQKTRSSHANKQQSKNVFASRQDLREVDQSVNLMDVDANKYDNGTGRRSGRGGRGNNNRRTSLMQAQAMVDVFLGGDHANSDSPFNPKNKKFRNLHYNNQESCWDRFTGCLQLVVKIVCSLPVLILLAVLGTGLIVMPMVLDHQSNANTVPKTNAPTPPPKTSAPTPAPINNAVEQPVEEEPKATTTTSNALYSPEQVEARTAAFKDVLLQANMDPDQVHQEALSWITEFDPAQMDLQDSTTSIVLERFAMAAFYFAMHPQATAIDLGLSLLQEDKPQAGRHRILSSNNPWMGPHGVCTWQGIECNPKNHQVIHLNVSHTQLQGSLPEELNLMTELVELDLSHNLIHGTLPPSYPTKLSNLEYVWLHANQIHGSLPTSIGDWTSVYHLDLSENQLTSSLPTELAQLTQTRLLYLHQNQLVGSIPLQLGHLPQIEYLYLGHNQFTGELPMDLLSRLSTLVDLQLNDNALTGTVPPEIESLHRLEFLSLANNKMHGELPEVFDRLHYLVEMDLSHNRFDGPLPKSLGSVSSLERLLLQDNKMVGSIPTSWLGLTSLEVLRLEQNNLTGDVPLCSLAKLASIATDCGSAIQCDCCEECS